jgi:hypothetical protein
MKGLEPSTFCMATRDLAPKLGQVRMVERKTVRLGEVR